MHRPWLLKITFIFITDGEPQNKETGAESTNLFNLDKYTNYSISVLAYTAAGDGVPSNPVYCRTKQDGESELNQ